MTVNRGVEPGADHDHGLPVFLSPRQREVLELAACGYTDRQIALQLEIQFTTVRSYMRRVCGRLRAGNRTQAVARALALGLIVLDPEAIRAELGVGISREMS